MKWRLTRRSRLIDALREKISSHSARSLKRALESNSCKVNGRIERFASVQLEAGDLIELAPLETQECLKPLYPILHEEEEFLVLNKPMRAVSTDAFFQKALQQPVYLAHRLDKDTTGVLLFGKTPKAARELQEAFARREIKKEYLALVDGVPKTRSGQIQSFFAKKGSFAGQTLWGSHPSGLYAETHWELVSPIHQNASLLRCFPQTGRTHQIRVHLAEMGHPILIDRQYATYFRSPLFAARPLLHAKSLQFTWKGTPRSFTAPLPADFAPFV